jgi:hypothetical protein
MGHHIGPVARTAKWHPSARGSQVLPATLDICVARDRDIAGGYYQPEHAHLGYQQPPLLDSSASRSLNLYGKPQMFSLA